MEFCKSERVPVFLTWRENKSRVDAVHVSTENSLDRNRHCFLGKAVVIDGARIERHSLQKKIIPFFLYRQRRFGLRFTSKTKGSFPATPPNARPTGLTDDQYGCRGAKTGKLNATRPVAGATTTRG